VTGSDLTNASFSIEMALYRNESLSTSIEAYDIVYVPDFIYVLIYFDIDSSNDRFFLQVIHVLYYSIIIP